MNSSYKEIVKVLKGDKRLIVDGRLAKNKIIELALQIDSDLIKLLRSSKDLEKIFFKKVGDVLVFDKIKFQSFVSNKQFLPDSFTEYKNKIGLIADNQYLTESNEVVLAFPYKDCVLEGGQTKEDAKRSEIFWNETLAPDEIDKLLQPKVLISSKRIDSRGEHKINEILDSDNLFIKGNNLIVLHGLRRRYAEKVKLIFIDPPYNREDDKSTFYNDSFNHSTWLTFIKNRLEASKVLLKKDGVIFISIDDSEQAYLKVLCDSIFGRDNFLANIAYERSGVSGLGQGGGFLVNTHESILCYAKDKKSFIPNDLSGETSFGYEEMKRYNKILQSVDLGEEVDRFSAPSTGEDVILYKHKNYNIENISLKKFEERQGEIMQQFIGNFNNVFRLTSVQEENAFQNKILATCKDGLYSARYLVSRGKNKGKWMTVFYMNGQIVVWLKDSASMLDDSKIVKTNKLSDFWDHASIPKADLANEGGVKLRRGKKPENLLHRIISMTTKKNDIVLDFFSGSGTTCAVSHKMNRQYIGVEQIDYGDNDSIIRLKNVINGDQSGVSKKVGWNNGGSFVYAELSRANQIFVDKIQDTKNTKELLKVWEEMKKIAFLSYKVKPEEIDSSKKDFETLSFEDQQRFLISILDKNLLYVPYSEIDDKVYSISKEDKELNKKFYNNK